MELASAQPAKLPVRRVALVALWACVHAVNVELRRRLLPRAEVTPSHVRLAEPAAKGRDALDLCHRGEVAAGISLEFGGWRRHAGRGESKFQRTARRAIWSTAASRPIGFCAAGLGVELRDGHLNDLEDHVAPLPLVHALTVERRGTEVLGMAIEEVRRPAVQGVVLVDRAVALTFVATCIWWRGIKWGPKWWWWAGSSRLQQQITAAAGAAAPQGHGSVRHVDGMISPDGSVSAEAAGRRGAEGGGNGDLWSRYAQSPCSCAPCNRRHRSHRRGPRAESYSNHTGQAVPRSQAHTQSVQSLRRRQRAATHDQRRGRASKEQEVGGKRGHGTATGRRRVAEPLIAEVHVASTSPRLQLDLAL